MKRLVENFDQFLQRTSIAQSGNPYVMGSNPKKKVKNSKDKRPKKKSKGSDQ